MLQIDQVRATAYHLQTNGMIDRFHGTLERILAKAVDEGIHWVNQFPFAPFELIYGRKVRISFMGVGHTSTKGFDASTWIKL